MKKISKISDTDKPFSYDKISMRDKTNMTNNPLIQAASKLLITQSVLTWLNEAIRFVDDYDGKILYSRGQQEEYKNLRVEVVKTEKELVKEIFERIDNYTPSNIYFDEGVKNINILRQQLNNNKLYPFNRKN